MLLKSTASLDMLPSLFLVELRTYQHPGMWSEVPCVKSFRCFVYQTRQISLRFTVRSLPNLYKHVAYFTLDAGPLARCQCPEGPATDHLDTGFLSWFPCVLKANAEVVTKYPRCHYMLLM